MGKIHDAARHCIAASCSKLSHAQFLQLPPHQETLLGLGPHGQPVSVSKSSLLELCRDREDLAYRLYRECDGSVSPETVLCRDLFEMPGNRRFPELADDELAISPTEP